VSLFVDALSDAGTQMTATLTSVAHAFAGGWRTGLEALLASPTALFYVAAFATMVVLVMGGLRRAGSAGYQRGRFLTANEKSFLMTLDAALGQNYRAFAQVRLAELANPTVGANPAAPTGVERRYGEERRFRDLRHSDARSGRRDRG
jgi:hypothetical protein